MVAQVKCLNKTYWYHWREILINRRHVLNGITVSKYRIFGKFLEQTSKMEFHKRPTIERYMFQLDNFFSHLMGVNCLFTAIMLAGLNVHCIQLPNKRHKRNDYWVLDKSMAEVSWKHERIWSISAQITENIKSYKNLTAVRCKKKNCSFLLLADKFLLFLDILCHFCLFWANLTYSWNFTSISVVFYVYFDGIRYFWPFLLLLYAWSYF